MLHNLYGSIIYVRPSPAFPTKVLTFDAEAAKQDYFTGDTRVAAVDSFMTKSALAELHEFCLESTVFHDTKVRCATIIVIGNCMARILLSMQGDGYIGGYVHSGLSSDLIFQIVQELPQRLPAVINEHLLVNLWAYS